MFSFNIGYLFFNIFYITVGQSCVSGYPAPPLLYDATFAVEDEIIAIKLTNSDKQTYIIFYDSYSYSLMFNINNGIT